MAGTLPSELVRHQQAMSKLNPKDILGSIIFYSITGEQRISGKRQSVPVRVTRDWLERQFEELDLDTRLLPPAIKRIDAFRQASSEIKADYAIPGRVERKAVLRVVEVTLDDERVVRKVMRDVMDSRSQLVNSVQMAELVFIRGPRATRGTPQSGEQVKSRVYKTLREVGLDMQYTDYQEDLSSFERDMLNDLLDTFKKRYEDLSENYGAQALRAVIRNYVTKLNAIACKPSGGVYFVHQSRAYEVAALEELVSRIGQGCTFHSLPLEDTDKQRGMLTEAFENEVEDECSLLMRDISVALSAAQSKGKPLSREKYREFNERFALIGERASEYTNVLGLVQERSASALEAVMDNITELAATLAVRTA